MRGTFGTLDSRQKELMRLAVIETLCAHFVSPPFFDPRAAAERTRPLDGATLDTVGRFVQSVNFSALDAVDVSSNEMRRFLEALMMRFLDVNPAFKHPRYTRYVPALRARAPRLAADVHRGLLASLDGKAPGYGAAPRKRSWTEGRERARKIAQEEYERTTRILEAAMIRSRIDDYTDTGFVPQVEPAEVARRPSPASAPIPAKPAQDTGYQPSATAGDLTVPVSATGFAAAFNAMGITETGVPPAVLRPPLQRPASNQPTGPQLAASALPRNGSTGPRELPSDLYDLYGDYLQDMQPDTAVHPALSARPGP
ncbi:MAG TPA: hypothetical protein VFN11_19110, partial [Ktedonobacterales bacterium]|nr:hypothetical protein [Ktedonobacterales bacterium]